MKLTGKAKEDFEKWIETLEVAPYVVMLENIPICYLNALIIEWLDSVGIFIFIEFGYKFTIVNNESSIFDKYYIHSTNLETRQEATEKAIEKANEIFK